MDDAELVRKMQTGDEEAFSRIYEKYRDVVYRTACLIMGDAAGGEDVAQDTWVDVYLHCHQLKNAESFRCWLFRILNRNAWNISKKRKHEIPDEYVLEKADGSDLRSPEYSFLEQEQENEVQRAVDHLKHKQKVAVILYYYNELSIKEIAAVTGSTEGTVKTRLFAARKKLAQLLGHMM